MKYKIFIYNNKSLAVHECEIIKDGRAVKVLRGILSWNFTDGLKTEPFDCEHTVRYNIKFYDTPEEAIKEAKKVIEKIISDEISGLKDEINHCEKLLREINV